MRKGKERRREDGEGECWRDRERERAGERQREREREGERRGIETGRSRMRKEE